LRSHNIYRLSFLINDCWLLSLLGVDCGLGSVSYFLLLNIAHVSSLLYIHVKLLSYILFLLQDLCLSLVVNLLFGWSGVRLFYGWLDLNLSLFIFSYYGSLVGLILGLFDCILYWSSLCLESSFLLTNLFLDQIGLYRWSILCKCCLLTLSRKGWLLFFDIDLLTRVSIQVLFLFVYKIRWWSISSLLLLLILVGVIDTEEHFFFEDLCWLGLSLVSDNRLIQSDTIIELLLLLRIYSLLNLQSIVIVNSKLLTARCIWRLYHALLLLIFGSLLCLASWCRHILLWFKHNHIFLVFALLLVISTHSHLGEFIVSVVSVFVNGVKSFLTSSLFLLKVKENLLVDISLLFLHFAVSSVQVLDSANVFHFVIFVLLADLILVSSNLSVVSHTTLIVFLLILL